MLASKPLLSFCFDMLFFNGIQHIKDLFIGNSRLQVNGYSYLQEYDCYIKDEMVEDNGVMPVFVTDIINIGDFLERLINFENNFIYADRQY